MNNPHAQRALEVLAEQLKGLNPEDWTGSDGEPDFTAMADEALGEVGSAESELTRESEEMLESMARETGIRELIGQAQERVKEVMGLNSLHPALRHPNIHPEGRWTDVRDAASVMDELLQDAFTWTNEISGVLEIEHERGSRRPRDRASVALLRDARSEVDEGLRSVEDALGEVERREADREEEEGQEEDIDLEDAKTTLESIRGSLESARRSLEGAIGGAEDWWRDIEDLIEETRERVVRAVSHALDELSEPDRASVLTTVMASSRGANFLLKNASPEVRREWLTSTLEHGDRPAVLAFGIDQAENHPQEGLQLSPAFRAHSEEADEERMEDDEPPLSDLEVAQLAAELLEAEPYRFTRVLASGTHRRLRNLLDAPWVKNWLERLTSKKAEWQEVAERLGRAWISLPDKLEEEPEATLVPFVKLAGALPSKRGSELARVKKQARESLGIDQIARMFNDAAKKIQDAEVSPQHLQDAVEAANWAIGHLHPTPPADVTAPDVIPEDAIEVTGPALKALMADPDRLGREGRRIEALEWGLDLAPEFEPDPEQVAGLMSRAGQRSDRLWRIAFEKLLPRMSTDERAQAAGGMEPEPEARPRAQGPA